MLARESYCAFPQARLATLLTLIALLTTDVLSISFAPTVQKFFADQVGNSNAQIVANCRTYNSNLACTSCLRDFYLSGQVCTAVASASIISNCNTYLNATACSYCDEGYYLSSSNGQCLQGNSSITCRVYSSANTCALCPAGYRLQNGLCSLVENCLVSNGVDCTQCSANYTLNANKVCQLTSSGTGGINNCGLVNADGSCAKCLSGAIFDFEKKSCVLASQIDSQIDPNCIDQRLSNGTFCSICRQGYKLNNSSRCDLVLGQETCLIHDLDDANKCRVCMSGYSMSSVRGSCSLNVLAASSQTDPLASAGVLKFFKLVLFVVLVTQLG